MPDTVRLHARIYGYVQGVSFRYHTFRQAQSSHLVGFVRNRMDGSVEVVAEGRCEVVKQFLSWLHVGPSSAEVKRVDVQWEQPTGEFGRFEVRF